MNKLFFGATAEKVVRTAGCPALTVPLPLKAKTITRELKGGGHETS
jgi:hypothetical protein